MSRFTTELLAVALLAATTMALAQAPPPEKRTPPDKDPALEKMTLEEVLALALKNNPDVRVAEAKLREVEAELARIRLGVVQKVLTLHAALEAARKTAADAEARLERVQKLRERSVVTSEMVDEAALTLAHAKAEVAKLEAEAPYLLGKPPPRFRVHELKLDPFGAEGSGDFRPRDPNAGGAKRPPPLPAAVEEKFRAALATSVKVAFDDVPFEDVLQYLHENAPELIFRNTLRNRGKAGNPTFTLHSKERLPVRAVLQLLEDEFPAPGVRFVVREYGILVVAPDAVPEGALLLQDLLRGDVQVARQPAGKNPPAEKVDGTVKQVDAATGLVTISVGSDAGLQKGHTLEVFRLNPPRYLGTLTVLEVQPTQAVGRIKGGKDAVQLGDRVASRPLGGS